MIGPLFDLVLVCAGMAHHARSDWEFHAVRIASSPATLWHESPTIPSIGFSVAGERQSRSKLLQY